MLNYHKMSLQGPGTGISGTSNQFSTGYSQTSGAATNAAFATNASNATFAASSTNATYANQSTYATNAGASQTAAYATNAGAATNAAAATNAGAATNATYATSAGYATNAGASQNAAYATNAGAAQGAYNATYAQSAGFATNATNAQSAYNANYTYTAATLQLTSAGASQWGWQGQNSNPAWLWGSNQGNIHTVFTPGSLSVGYATNAGNATNAGYAQSAGNAGYANSAGYAGSSGNAGYANSAGGVQGATGYIRAWRAYQGNASGISQFQQQSTNVVRVAFNDSWGSYYGVLADSISGNPQWQGGYVVFLTNAGQTLQNTGNLILFP